MAFIYDYSVPLFMRMTSGGYNGGNKAPKSHQLAVSPISVGLNPIDFKIPILPVVNWVKKGSIVGCEFCGQVDAVGDKVTGFKVGDIIVGGATNGALASKITVEEGNVVKCPESLNPKEAGGYTAAALTAYQALKYGSIEKAKTVVILGASGGVGHAAVQIAKALAPKGAVIIGVCSSKNEEFVKSLGADKVVTYDKPGGFNLSEEIGVGKVDLVFDCVSNPNFDYQKDAWPLLNLENPDCHYVAINSSNNLDWPKAGIKKLTGLNLFKSHYHLMMVDFHKPDIEKVMELYQSGKLKTRTAKTLKFEESEILKAFEELKKERATGKFVVQF
jgi:NADPH:quinone reductase-like Zn-dependent oxidoreductase